MTAPNLPNDSPKSSSRSLKNVSRDANIHMFTPEQRAIHQNTVQRHLSNRPPNTQNLDTLRLSDQSSPISFNRSQISQPDTEEKSTSRSFVGDLPIFPKHSDLAGTVSSNSNGMPKNKSAPSLSKLQRQNVESGVYLHPTQIPRSLSATFINYQPDMWKEALFDLPIGDTNVRVMLQQALSKVDDHLRALPAEEVGQMAIYQSQSGVSALSQAIPTAPDAIPETAIEKDIDLSHEADEDELNGVGDHDTRMMSVSIGDASDQPMPHVPSYQKRMEAESVKHDIEQALKQGYTRNLVIAVLQALVQAFLYGWNIGCLNVPQNVVQNEVTHMSDNQWGLINSMFCAGGLIGALAAGPLQDRLGRKKAMMVIDAFFIMSALETFLYAADDMGVDPGDEQWYFLFWLGRFIVGLACGAATAIVPTYLGEIAPPLIRGAIGTSNQLTVTFGIVVSNVVGYDQLMGGKNTWPWLFLPNLVPIIQLLTAFSFPESPKWLMNQGREGEARKALQRLRMTKDVRMDMTMMKGGMRKKSSFVSRNSKGGKEHTQPLLADQTNGHAVTIADGSLNQKMTVSLETEDTSSGAKKFGIPVEEYKSVKWAVIIAVVLMWMQQLSGINAIMFYSSNILKHAGITSSKGEWLGTTGINLANFLGVFIPVYFIDKAGRRILLVTSGIIMIIASVAVSVAILMNETHGGPIWGNSSIAFLILFVVGFEVGLGPIPWLMMAELAPMQYRGPIVSVATGMNWTANLLIAQCAPLVMNSHILLFGFAVFTFLGILFTLRFIPETNGKTAAEIARALGSI